MSEYIYERKRKKNECWVNEKCAQEETMEMESVNKNQNKKQAEVSTTTEQNKIQKEKTDQEFLAKAPINITFDFVLK